jgi:hypothetical protein
MSVLREASYRQSKSRQVRIGSGTPIRLLSASCRLTPKSTILLLQLIDLQLIIKIILFQKKIHHLLHPAAGAGALHGSAARLLQLLTAQCPRHSALRVGANAESLFAASHPFPP